MGKLTACPNETIERMPLDLIQAYEILVDYVLSRSCLSRSATQGRYRPTLRDKTKSPCQRGAVHTWDLLAESLTWQANQYSKRANLPLAFTPNTG